LSTTSLPPGTELIDSTWAMKKKANGTHHARWAARGFKQKPGAHYNPNSTSSPVVSDVSVRILFVIAALSGWPMHGMAVEAAFLHGEFEDGETIYMTVPQLLKTLYGLIPAALAFWRKLVKAFLHIGFTRCLADTCLFYKWTKNGIVIWAVVVDDCLGAGPEKELLTSKYEFMMVFNCDDQGEMKEYIGCKVERIGATIKVLQPELLQSFRDEFEIEAPNKIGTPAVPGKVLQLGAQDLTPYEQFTYRSGVGKLIHLTTRHLGCGSGAGSLHEVMQLGAHSSHETLHELFAQYRKAGPNSAWGGSDHVFVITGRTDSNFAACPDTRRSVIGYTVFVHMAPTENKCNMRTRNWRQRRAARNQCCSTIGF
jgi:Reverse transcriptase (RNA-dependent DNA polymerase)